MTTWKRKYLKKKTKGGFYWKKEKKKQRGNFTWKKKNPEIKGNWFYIKKKFYMYSNGLQSHNIPFLLNNSTTAIQQCTIY